MEAELQQSEMGRTTFPVLGGVEGSWLGAVGGAIGGGKVVAAARGDEATAGCCCAGGAVGERRPLCRVEGKHLMGIENFSHEGITVAEETSKTPTKYGVSLYGSHTSLSPPHPTKVC